MKRQRDEPLFSDPAELLRYLAKTQAIQESPGERRLRLALKVHTTAIDVGQAFADKKHLALRYPLSNRQGGRKRKRSKRVEFVPWYAKDGTA